MAPKTHGMSHPLLGLGFSCFACLKQTTTSVFTLCFVCGLKREEKIVASVKTDYTDFYSHGSPGLKEESETKEQRGRRAIGMNTEL